MTLAWTPDDTRLLSGSGHKYIREWDTSTWQQVGHPYEGHPDHINAIVIHPAGTLVASASGDNHVRLWRLSDQRTIAIFQHPSYPNCVTFSVDGKHILSGGEFPFLTHYATRASFVQILDITTARDACLTGDLSTAEELLTQEIHTNADDFTPYANRSFVMARKHDLDCALEDAIKAITLFNTDQCEEVMLFIKDLAAACPNIDPLTRRVVETYLCVQLRIKAFNGMRHDEAADHFTAIVNSVMQAEIPGQDHDGYDAEPNFYEMRQVFKSVSFWSLSHSSLQYSQILGPRLQQRAGRLKRLRLPMTKRPESVPAPGPGPPATLPKLTYDAYLPYHSIMQHHLLLTFLSLKVDSVTLQRVLLGVSP
ncbi:hypothetical protein BDR06DRAFT_1013197 [Suillus hirtellus]|nr:hypothetical protein BDR06DRAFT_1013197 [Suillus hirtellus]